MTGLLLSAVLLLSDPRPGFGWPLHGTPVVERGFDPPETDYGAGHRGVDLAAGAGDEVVAAGPGTVTYAGLLAGRGVVAVTHAGGLRTTYEPVAATVALGDVVDRGDALGTVTTGHASCRFGTCLHWGLRRGDAYLDPLALVLGGPVRLLPVGTPPEEATPAAAPVGPARPALRARPSAQVRARPSPAPAAVAPASPSRAPDPVVPGAVVGLGLAGLAVRRRRG